MFWCNPKRIEVRFLQRFTAGYQAMNFRDGRFGSSRPHQYDVDAQLAEAGVYCLIAGVSAKMSLAPESSSPYSSSGPVHQEFMGTTIAPSIVIAI